VAAVLFISTMMIDYESQVVPKLIRNGENRGMLSKEDVVIYRKMKVCYAN
jgi:hypothetical protein